MKFDIFVTHSTDAYAQNVAIATLPAKAGEHQTSGRQTDKTDKHTHRHTHTKDLWRGVGGRKYIAFFFSFWKNF